MEIEGGCYCGNLRYQVTGDPMFKLACLCRECQYISGGGANYSMALPEAGFRWTKGSPKEFRRGDLETPVTREFCADCGTHILSRAPSVAGAVIVKVGTFDDPGVFEAPQMAIFTVDRQSFHHLPDGLPTFERTPGG